MTADEDHALHVREHRTFAEFVREQRAKKKEAPVPEKTITITIELPAEDAATIRRAQVCTPRTFIGRTIEAVRLALPPDAIEPKAGGTCKLLGNFSAVCDIRWVTPGWWVVTQYDGNMPAVWSWHDFESVFEVLS